MNQQPVVELTEVRFGYPGGTAPVLDIASFALPRGQQLLLRGASGSGKSTLLALIAGVLQPTAGCVRVAGQDLAALRKAARDRFRADHCGVVFQQFNLLPFLSTRDNIALGLQFSARRGRLAPGTQALDTEIERLMVALGLDVAALWSRPAARLSVGQQQRVAAARALIARPPLLLADEPTSALDPLAAQAFLQLLFAECRQGGTSSIVVSHDPSIAPLFDAQADLATLNRASAGGAR
ncbi:ATP-binding cassette domain-containing protein [Xanthomonas sp. 3307]|uniref:ABC transporter ATP-binding protein n=1 Tax=Xanthomonas sp. 3307 TaxID=3035316 RepID=UPI00160FB88D|nr:ATP-binding cassette domain-containing protein [Xanthomonas sp. 3307]MBB5944069.1 putative ABC transport system ATP-binding protein [Xanthomonas sp. 3307]